MFSKRSLTSMVLIIGISLLIGLEANGQIRYPLNGDYKNQIWGYWFAQDLNKDKKDKEGKPLPPYIHLGEDVGRQGDPVYPITTGVVKYAGFFTEDCGWGYFIVIEYTVQGITFCQMSGHLANNLQVKVNDEIKVEDLNKPIAYVGPQGRDNGNWAPHLHTGIHIGGFGAKEGTYPSWLKGYTSSWAEVENWRAVSEFVQELIQSEESFSKFRSLTELYLNSPYPNTRYYNGKARDLVGNPLYEQRENGNKYQDYWSFLIPTDKGWSLCITYTPGAVPSEDKYLAPYPIAIHLDLVEYYKANRNALGSALCDTILDKDRGVIELPC